MSNKPLRTLALTLLITGAIDSIRNLPTTALFGSSLIFFFILAAIVFLIPTALVSAELASNIKEKGGIYHWVKLAFGERIGFLAVWLQWVNNLAFFPAILSFIAGTGAYLINPSWPQNKYYLVGMILTLFWGLTLLNLRGIKISARFTTFCALVGLILPMALIIILMIVWIAMGHPIQISLAPANLIPDLHHSQNWIALTAIVLAYLGMELAAVHVKDVENPQKTFPRALALSTLFILSTMTLGSLAIAMVLPSHEINLINGTIQTFAYFLNAYQMSWLLPVMTVLLIIGSLGGIISWVISPIRGLLQAAQNDFFPDFLKKENKYGVAQNLLLTQAVLVSLFCTAFILVPTVNGSYWLLSVLTAQLSILMYIILFLSGLVIRKKVSYVPGGFVIPGKKIGLWSVCLLGLTGCIVTMIVGFFPPEGINVGSLLRFELLQVAGIMGMILPVLYFWMYQARHRGKPPEAGDAIPLVEPTAD